MLQRFKQNFSREIFFQGCTSILYHEIYPPMQVTTVRNFYKTHTQLRTIVFTFMRILDLAVIALPHSFQPKL